MAMTILGSLLWLLSMFFIGTAAAQAPSWPIVNGRQLQPTQRQIDSTRSDKARQWDREVQPEIDRLYEELTRDSPRPRR